MSQTKANNSRQFQESRARCKRKLGNKFVEKNYLRGWKQPGTRK